MARELTRWSPLDDLLNMSPRDVFARLRPGGGITVDWSPRCDIEESEDEIIVHAELPGVAVADMEVEVREGRLRIRGEKRTQKSEEQEGRTVSERFFGSFERAIPIPATVDETKITASLKDGVLEVRLPRTRAAEHSARKVEITGG